MSDVPTDLLPEILIRLPGDALFRFRCVCEAWRSLIDRQTLRKLHVIRSRQQHGDQDDDNLYIMDCGYKKKHQLGNRIKSMSISHYDNLCKFLHEYLTYKPNKNPTLPLPSCDGLVLIPGIGESHTRWALCNPFSGDFHKLPRDPSVGRGLYSAGFGYDYVHDDYKVVMVTPCKTWIYSLKSNEWHMIDNNPNCACLDWFGGDGVFFNGAIHWISLRMDEGMILALDLSTENYRQLQTPSHPNGAALYNRALNALNGELFFISRSGSQLDTWLVWIMKDYGGNNTWTEFMSFDHHHVEVPRSVDLGYPKLMAYVKGRQKVLIMYNSYNLKFEQYKKAFWFDLVKKCTTAEVPIKDLPCDVIIICTPASLIDLKKLVVYNDRASATRKRPRLN